MTKFLHQTEFENQRQNESNDMLDNQLMILEFAPFAKKIVLFDQQSLGIKLFLGILLVIMETLGNYLLFCMVWYETFGMDSKKRTITNQLFSRMLLALIIFNLFIMPMQYVGLWIPFSKYRYFKKQLFSATPKDFQTDYCIVPINSMVRLECGAKILLNCA